MRLLIFLYIAICIKLFPIVELMIMRPQGPYVTFTTCEQQSQAASDCYSKLVQYLDKTLALLIDDQAKDAAAAFNQYTIHSLSEQCYPHSRGLLQDCGCADPTFGPYCPDSAELIARFKTDKYEIFFGTLVKKDVRSRFRKMLVQP